MKNITLIIITVFISALTFSCREIETEDVSRITYFPDFEFNGEQFMVVDLGSDYVEPGVVVTEQGEEISYETVSTVDTGAPGFYTVTYLAENSDGFDASVTRTVVVKDPAAPDLDLAGSYTSNTPAFGGESLGQKMTIEKLAPGIYSATDSYAHPSLDIAVRFLTQPDGTALMETLQNSPFGGPMYGILSFDVSEGEDIPLAQGGTIAAPRDASLIYALYLGAHNSTQIKTWVKD